MHFDFFSNSVNFKLPSSEQIEPGNVILVIGGNKNFVYSLAVYYPNCTIINVIRDKTI